MYFLLTGIELPAETLRQPPKLSGFPKPLRNLLSQMLHPNPDQRPKDLVVLGEMIRSCLLKIDRRLALADRYGIPFRTTIPDRTSLGRGVCCEQHWRLVRSSWLQRCLLHSCCRGRLAKSYIGLARQSRLAFLLAFPNLHQRRPQSKMLLRQWLLRLCCRRRQIRLWGPRITSDDGAAVPNSSQAAPRIFNRLKHRAANRRPIRPKTLSRPLRQAQLPENFR